MAKHNFKYDDIFTELDKENIRQDYVMNHLSLREVREKYNIKSNSYAQKLLKPVIRSVSEANVIAHRKKPDSFKHSEESKQKIRTARLKYMKEHPEETAWRKRNEPSYPEKCFINFLKDKGYDKRFLIEREKTVFPFFIDFAFVDIKLAVEIDGSQHIVDEERKQRDILKNKTLLDNGWKVLRISENIVKSDWSLLNEKIENAIGNNNITFETVGIVKPPKQYQKVERNADGYSQKQLESSFKQRKVIDRPSKKLLLQELIETSFTEVGRKYGVTDNTIRKWCKFYKLPHRKKDLKNMVILIN